MSSKKNFVKGAAILGIAGILCKIIGVAFRIPLTNMIKTDGIAYYQVAYPIYSFLLVVSSAGFPSAISKMVSERTAVGNYRGANQVFRVAFRALFIIGIAASVLMALFSRVYANSVQVPQAYLSIMALSPALFFVSLISAYRGYFQGLEIMTPTAGSQLVEQIAKVVFGLALAFLWVGGGKEYGAAGALVGVTISEALALFMLVIVFGRRKKAIRSQITHSPRTKQPRNRQVLKQLLKIAVPITIGASIMPLVQMVDTSVVVSSLTGLGYSNTAAKSMFGALTGPVNTMVNMPAVLSLALAMSLVPSIAASLAEKNPRSVRNKAQFGLKLALLVGLPCSVGFFVLAQPIIELLYGGLSAAEQMISIDLLKTMSAGILFLTLVQSMTGVLQGLSRVMVPVVNLLVGAVLKIVTELILISQPHINIHGAPISTIICYATAAILNIIYVLKYTRSTFKFVDMIVRPGLATAVMGLIAYFGYGPLSSLLGSRIATIATIGIAGIAYFVCVLLFGVIRPHDAELLPGGGRLAKLMYRLGLWKKDERVRKV